MRGIKNGENFTVLHISGLLRKNMKEDGGLIWYPLPRGKSLNTRRRSGRGSDERNQRIQKKQRNQKNLGLCHYFRIQGGLSWPRIRGKIPKSTIPETHQYP